MDDLGITAATMARRANMVVILIPPAVPAGPAPINIKVSIANKVDSCICPISIELKPVVRVWTA